MAKNRFATEVTFNNCQFTHDSLLPHQKQQNENNP